MSVEDYIGHIEHIRRQIEAFSSPKRCYADFVGQLGRSDINRAIEQDIRTALDSASWDSREEYLDTFEGDEESHIYQIVAHELEHVFVAGGESEIVEQLAQRSADRVRDPVFCAKHLAGRHLLNRTLAVLYDELRSVQIEAELEIGEGKRYGLGGYTVERLRELLHPYVEEQLKDRIRAMTGFFRLATIEGAHGLFVPDYCELEPGAIKSPSPLDLVIATIADRPGLTGSVRPRDFEEVIARIFSEQGVEVELTASTRDGGRDIICTAHQEDGTEKRTAIEVKRYTATTKITFSKITSFVGANILDYRNLIYVTTSSYTRPVEGYAARVRAYPGVDSLELKELSHIVEWAKAHKSRMLLESY